jgi:hypothetical protein
VLQRPPGFPGQRVERDAFADELHIRAPALERLEELRGHRRELGGSGAPAADLLEREVQPGNPLSARLQGVHLADGDEGLELPHQRALDPEALEKSFIQVAHHPPPVPERRCRYVGGQEESPGLPDPRIVGGAEHGTKSLVDSDGSDGGYGGGAHDLARCWGCPMPHVTRATLKKR